MAVSELAFWAPLIKRVYEVEPPQCPDCGNAMKIISFSERRQTAVIQRILRHCGLWTGILRAHASPRAPTTAQQSLPTASSEGEKGVKNRIGSLVVLHWSSLESHG
ncbi:MAG: hypothetical protein GY743_00310 [Planctomycetaceae bacterium]|nr:hypothetical protein [Planctomycetaceae bacterium]